MDNTFNGAPNSETVLQNLLHTFTMGLASTDDLEAMGIAFEQMKKQKEKEKLVIERFGKPYIAKRQKNGKETEYFRVDYNDEGTKERRQISAVSYSGLIDKLYDLIGEDTSDGLKANATVEDVFNKYVRERNKLVEAGAISSQTAAYDESNWKRFFSGRAFTKRPIKDISAPLLEKEFQLICGDGTRYTKKAIQKAKSLLSGIFQQALMEGIITVNTASIAPINKCKFIIENHSEDSWDSQYYSQEDVRKLREYIRSLPQDTYTLGILLHTYIAARIGETRALTWEDYNAATGELTIWHEIIQDRQGEKARVDRDVPHTKSCKSQGRRTIVLPREAMDVIEELRKINGDKKYMLNGSRNAKFSIPPNRINEHIRKYCNGCGITYYSSHKFRFYGITRLYEAGVDEEKISYLAGHTTCKMTQHYDRSKSSKKQVSREEMRALL